MVAATTLDGAVEAARAAERAGAFDEALRHYEDALARLPAEGDARRAAELLRWIGQIHFQRGDLEQATELFETSLAVAGAAALRGFMAAAVNCLACVHQVRGDIAGAEERYLHARKLADEAADERLMAMVDQNLGILANIRGDVEAALRRYRSALQHFRRLDDTLASAWALNNMAMAHVDLEAWDDAESCFDEAFDLADRLHDTGMLGRVEINRVELYLKRRDFGRARECCDRAFEIFSRAGSKRWLAETYKFYGVLYRETAKVGLAETHLATAVELARDCQDRLLEAEAERERALLHAAQDRNREALQSLNRAHRLFSELGARRELLDLEGRLDRLEEVYLRVVATWGESIESNDRYTAGHCQRVADYACRLAEAVGFSGRDLIWLRMGAFLHDVGKTTVPAELLNKPGSLTADEWEVMKAHTTAGDEIVAELDFPWDIRPIVRNHHERWDGTGYPDGLAGEEIPLTARILCVADVFDALTTARSYRPALSREEALRTMARDAGKILDPHLFARFLSLLEAEEAGTAAGTAAVVHA